MWVGLIQSVEALKKKCWPPIRKKEFWGNWTQAATSALPWVSSLSAYPIDSGLACLHNCVSQFLKITHTLSLSVTLSLSFSLYPHPYPPSLFPSLPMSITNLVLRENHLSPLKNKIKGQFIQRILLSDRYCQREDKYSNDFPLLLVRIHLHLQEKS